MLMNHNQGENALEYLPSRAAALRIPNTRLFGLSRSAAAAVAGIRSLSRRVACDARQNFKIIPSRLVTTARYYVEKRILER